MDGVLRVDYKIIGRLFGRERVRKVGRFLQMAGVEWEPEVLLGLVIYFSIGLALVAYFLSAPIIPFYSPLIGVGTFVVLVLAVYAHLLLKIDVRKKRVEEMLPEFLQLASANVRAGMPIDRAMLTAARPEFGLLAVEVEGVIKRTFGGEPFIQALRRLSARFESKLLSRTVNLIVEGMASGGEIAEVLDRTAIDIRSAQLMRKEIAATMQMYVIFVAFASVIGAPMLFALSHQLMKVMDFIWGNIMAQNPQGLPRTEMVFFSPLQPAISAGQFYEFSVVSSIITATFASLIIATIQTGSTRNGIKYVPFFVLASLFVLFVIGQLFSALFAGMLVVR